MQRKDADHLVEHDDRRREDGAGSRARVGALARPRSIRSRGRSRCRPPRPTALRAARGPRPGRGGEPGSSRSRPGATHSAAIGIGAIRACRCGRTHAERRAHEQSPRRRRATRCRGPAACGSVRRSVRSAARARAPSQGPQTSATGRAQGRSRWRATATDAARPVRRRDARETQPAVTTARTRPSARSGTYAMLFTPARSIELPLHERRRRRVVHRERRGVEHSAGGSRRLVAEIDAHVVPREVDAVAPGDHARRLAEVFADEDERAELDAEHLDGLVDHGPPDSFDGLRADERRREPRHRAELTVELRRPLLGLAHARAAADEPRLRPAEQEDEGRGRARRSSRRTRARARPRSASGCRRRRCRRSPETIATAGKIVATVRSPAVARLRERQTVGTITNDTAP